MRRLTDAEARIVGDNLPLLYWGRKKYAAYIAAIRPTVPDDVVYDALVDALIRAVQQDTPHTLSTVFGRIAIQTLINRAKAAGRVKRRPTPEKALKHARDCSHRPRGEADCRDPSPPDAVEVRLDAGLALALLPTLTHGERAAVERTVLEADRLCVVAEDLGVSKQRVKQLQVRGLRKLQEALCDG